MDQAWARVCLEVQSLAGNVALVRAALAGVGEVVGLGDELVADLKIAVSEACENVVDHAYGESTGPMLIGIRSWSGGAAVSVRDRGVGIARSAREGERVGLGLSVMRALSRRAEFSASPQRGTEVRLWFGSGRGNAQNVEPPSVADGGLVFGTLRDRDVLSCVSPVSALRPVLGRVFRSQAAASLFTIGRFSDLCAITDAVADYAECAAADSVGFAVSAGPRRLSLAAGPFGPRDGPFRRSPAAEVARRQALCELADEVTLELVEAREVLNVAVVQLGR